MNVNILIDQLMSIFNAHLDGAEQCKNSFSDNSMRNAFFQVLCELKSKTGMNFSSSFFLYQI